MGLRHVKRIYDDDLKKEYEEEITVSPVELVKEEVVEALEKIENSNNINLEEEDEVSLEQDFSVSENKSEEKVNKTKKTVNKKSAPKKSTKKKD